MYFSAALRVAGGILNAYRPGISAVTAESLKAAVKKYFPAPPYTTVVVGMVNRARAEGGGISYRVVEAKGFVVCARRAAILTGIDET